MKIIFTIAISLLMNFGYSQGNTICIYKVKKNEILKVKDSTNKTEKVVNRMMNRALNTVDRLEYRLIYNNKESVFKFKDMLTGGSEEENRFTKLAEVITSSGIYYQNVCDDLTLHQFETYGEKFLVNEPLEGGWEISNEKKIIGDYTCYKAIKKCKSCNNSNVSEVWFTPHIAVPFGPKGFGGLPGLIVEVKMKIVTLYLDKILKNQDIEIKRLTRGKSVTLKEYKEISSKLRPKR